MKFCSECGTKFESESAKFCPNCGASRELGKLPVKHATKNTVQDVLSGTFIYSQEDAENSTLSMDEKRAMLDLAETQEPKDAIATLLPMAESGVPLAFPLIGYHLAKLGLFTEAKEWTQTGVDDNVDIAFTNMALLLENEGDLSGAKAVLLRGVENGQSSSMYGLAKLLQRSGDFEGHKIWVTRAAEAGDSNALAELQDGVTEEWIDNPDGTSTFVMKRETEGGLFVVTDPDSPLLKNRIVEP